MEEMDGLVVSIKGHKGIREAEIRASGDQIYLCANGKNLQIAPAELYDMITLLMSQYYEDFTHGEGRQGRDLHEHEGYAS
jgi:hypothetical protein